MHCAVTCSHFLHLLRIIKAILTPLAISSQYLTNIWPLLLCPTRRKTTSVLHKCAPAPTVFTNFQTFLCPTQKSAAPWLLGKRVLAIRGTYQNWLYFKRDCCTTLEEFSYHALTLTLPFCLQVSYCANNWTFVDTQYSMMAGQSI